MNSRILAAAIAALSLTACGGGGGGNSAPQVPVIVPTAPPPLVVASPASLSFLAVGNAAMQTVAASEVAYSGNFSASSPLCQGIVTVALTQGSTNSFAVTPSAAGTCSFTISDNAGRSTTIAVTVTTTSVGGN